MKSKKIILMIFILFSILSLSSCDRNGEILMDEEKKADVRIEQIVTAINEKDSEILKSLFSKKALDESDDFEGGTDSLFNFIQGDIVSWERDGFASDELIDSGKRSWMIRFGFTIKTDKEQYQFYLIDYNIDTINPDNQGVYMLELIDNYGEKELESWQDRMRAGIYIH